MVAGFVTFTGLKRNYGVPVGITAISLQAEVLSCVFLQKSYFEAYFK